MQWEPINYWSLGKEYKLNVFSPLLRNRTYKNQMNLLTYCIYNMCKSIITYIEMSKQ
jgi:hypothetical protein